MHVNQPFIPFKHHVWGETVPWGTIFIIQTSGRMQYFTILQYKVHSFNIQDDRSKHAWAFSSTVKKTSKITFAERAVVVFEWTLTDLRFNIIKNLLWSFFYLFVLSICNLQKRLMRAAFWVTSASDVHWTTETKRHSD